MATKAISVDGLTELNRAFARAERDVRLEFRGTLRKAAKPVKDEAEVLASTDISHMATPPWTKMRVGVTRSLVYVAPRERGVKSKTNRARRRPQFGDTLLDKALEPALEHNIDGITGEVELMLAGISKDWARF